MNHGIDTGFAFHVSEMWRGVKKPGFWGVCQENIIDKWTIDTRFDQCLQGFRSLKISVTMSCGILALCAIIIVRKAAAVAEAAMAD